MPERPDINEIEDTWQEFHRVVNMTSAELSDWLLTRSAGEDSEELPDRAGPDLSRHVLAILGKRKVDLTKDDVRIMRRVIDRVHTLRGEELEPTAGEQRWRYRLMSIGHDPLKPLAPGRRSSSTT